MQSIDLREKWLQIQIIRVISLCHKQQTKLVFQCAEQVSAPVFSQLKQQSVQILVLLYEHHENSMGCNIHYISFLILWNASIAVLLKTVYVNLGTKFQSYLGLSSYILLLFFPKYVIIFYYNSASYSDMRMFSFLWNPNQVLD